MGLTPDMKAQKDRARAHKLMRRYPWMLKAILVAGFREDGKRTKKGVAQAAREITKGKSWADVSMLKQLVGQGYLRPAGDGYTITKKGLQLRNEGGEDAHRRPAPEIAAEEIEG
ncbi:hypothetical protein BAE30_02965 [Acidithiobacillus caldus]|uniref:Uncharacterized protein n=1 Tax=Acidithiobacillus caldus TaxID=33059 RepID=A0A1E7Z032_9PROT|nr:hypothetical protein BAE30_02965 [Acidithiobacillus caldus]